MNFKQLVLEELVDGYSIEYCKGPVDHILDLGSAKNKHIQNIINDGHDSHEGDLKWLLFVNGKECILAQDATWDVDDDPLCY